MIAPIGSSRPAASTRSPEHCAKLHLRHGKHERTAGSTPGHEQPEQAGAGSPPHRARRRTGPRSRGSRCLSSPAIMRSGVPSSGPGLRPSASVPRGCLGPATLRRPVPGLQSLSCAIILLLVATGLLLLAKVSLLRPGAMRPTRTRPESGRCNHLSTIVRCVGPLRPWLFRWPSSFTVASGSFLAAGPLNSRGV